MQEPTDKAQLLDRIRAERAALDDSVAGMADERLAEPGVAGHWSAKDILAHITWWEQRTIEKLRGESTPHDQLGGEDNDQKLDLVNDQAYREHRDRPASDVRAAFHASLQTIVEALAGLDEQSVLASLDFIADNTYRHYPEHVAQIHAHSYTSLHE
jgi:Mycothiol maleylpyruvate isomerase N-terminal domain